MANKGTKGSETKVTRIKAVDTAPSKKSAKSAPAEAAATKVAKVKPEEHNIWIVRVFKGIGGYFAGAWKELREVRWPNRKATWSLTLAVLAFCAFFVIIILLLDALFKYLFELIIK